MSFFLRGSLFFLLILFSPSLFSQFEKISIRNNSIEYEKDLIEDTSADYLKIMLCGDLIHRNQLMKKYAPVVNGAHSYRSWFRQVKPLFFYPDFVVANLQSFFPNRSDMSAYANSAPDEYLAELDYTGFNVMMMCNSSALTDKKTVNAYTLKKLNATDIFKVGYYKDSNEKKANFPLILEKKDIRLAFLNYSLDSVLLDLPQDEICFFNLDSIKKDVEKSRKTMLADYVIAYIDWAKQDSLKLTKVVELFNIGIDVIIGTGNGEAFTNADLLAYSDGSLKLHVDNIGHFNAASNERENDKSAVVEIVLKKDRKTKQVSTYDMGFIPIWTLIDNERYAVLPISNIEEKHIENINLNLIQYSAMKIALTDLRYAFFDKIPELHYDFTDKHVSQVEQTGFIRKTLMREQDKINETIKERGLAEYVELFGQEPPALGSDYIPYEDEWGIYPKKSNRVYTPIEIDAFNAIDTNKEQLTLEDYIRNKKALEKLEDRQDKQYKADYKEYEKNKSVKETLDSLLLDELNYQSQVFYGEVKEPKVENVYDKYKKWMGEGKFDDFENLRKFFMDITADRLNNNNSIKNAFDSLDNIPPTKNYINEPLAYRDTKKINAQIDDLLSKYKKIFDTQNESELVNKKLRNEMDSLQNQLIRYKTHQRKKLNIAQFKQTNTAQNKNGYNNRDTFEYYGQIDEISKRGIINIKANHKSYQRERVVLLTAEEKRVQDSIRRYNERFIVVDSFAELKKILKKKKIDSVRRRDSLFKASLNPNYKPTYNPEIEPGSADKPYVPNYKSGVFTSIDFTKEENAPVKTIEEYFLVQVFTFSTQKEIDLDKYPYLTGYEVRYEEGYYRYYVGKTNSQKLAVALCRSIRAKGHNDAMLVKYTNGVRTVVKINY